MLAIRDRLDQFQRRFFSRPSAVQTRLESARLEQTFRRPQWVVGRDLCLFHSENFSNVPKARRVGALTLKLPLWSPFTHTGHYTVWSDGKAMVWLWDADLVQVDGSLLDGRDANVNLVPETVLFPRHAHGFRIQACRNGFELQHWREGVLAGSLWLADTPTEERIAWFAERQGIGADFDVGQHAIVPPDLADVPWTGPIDLRQWLIGNERQLVAVGVALLLVVGSWQEGRIWQNAISAAQSERDLLALEDQLGPLFNQRDAFLRLRRQNEALARLMNVPTQAEVMVQVDKAIPNEGAVFQDWRYSQGALALAVADPEADPVAYVQALEAQPLLTGVAPGPTRGQQANVTFDMSVRRP